MEKADLHLCKRKSNLKSLLLIGFCSFNLAAYPNVNNSLYAQSKSFTIELSNTTVKDVFDHIVNLYFSMIGIRSVWMSVSALI